MKITFHLDTLEDGNAFTSDALKAISNVLTAGAKTETVQNTAPEPPANKLEKPTRNSKKVINETAAEETAAEETAAEETAAEETAAEETAAEEALPGMQTITDQDLLSAIGAKMTPLTEDETKLVAMRKAIKELIASFEVSGASEIAPADRVKFLNRLDILG